MVQLALPSAWCTFNTKSRLLFHFQSLPICLCSTASTRISILRQSCHLRHSIPRSHNRFTSSQMADRDNALPTLTRGFSLSNKRPIATGSCSVKFGSSLSRTIPAGYGSKAVSIFFKPDDDGKPTWKCQTNKADPVCHSYGTGGWDSADIHGEYGKVRFGWGAEATERWLFRSAGAGALTGVACDPEKWSFVPVQPKITSDTIRNQSRDSDDREDHKLFNDFTLKRPRNHEGPNLLHGALGK